MTTENAQELEEVFVPHFRTFEELANDRDSGWKRYFNPDESLPKKTFRGFRGMGVPSYFDHSQVDANEIPILLKEAESICIFTEAQISSPDVFCNLLITNREGGLIQKTLTLGYIVAAKRIRKDITLKFINDINADDPFFRNNSYPSLWNRDGIFQKYSDFIFKPTEVFGLYTNYRQSFWPRLNNPYNS